MSTPPPIARESARETLERRARDLARPVDPRAAARVAKPDALAVFEIGDERYGIEARHVREVVRLGAFARLPGVPAFVAGITVIRGEIVVVVDLRTLLGLPRRGVTDLARIVVLGDDASEIGVLADRAAHVVELDRAEVLALPRDRESDGDGLVRGVTRDGVVVLDGALLLADRRLTIDDTLRGDLP